MPWFLGLYSGLCCTIGTAYRPIFWIMTCCLCLMYRYRLFVWNRTSSGAIVFKVLHDDSWSARMVKHPDLVWMDGAVSRLGLSGWCTILTWFVRMVQYPDKVCQDSAASRLGLSGWCSIPTWSVRMVHHTNMICQDGAVSWQNLSGWCSIRFHPTLNAWNLVIESTAKKLMNWCICRQQTLRSLLLMERKFFSYKFLYGRYLLHFTPIVYIQHCIQYT